MTRSSQRYSSGLGCSFKVACGVNFSFSSAMLLFGNLAYTKYIFFLKGLLMK